MTYAKFIKKLAFTNEHKAAEFTVELANSGLTRQQLYDFTHKEIGFDCPTIENLHSDLASFVTFGCMSTDPHTTDPLFTLHEIEDDVFNPIYAERTPCHCISADRAMGAGIAVPMAEKYNLRPVLAERKEECFAGTCVFANGVMNLITKTRCWEKPTYESLEKSLVKMKDLCIENNITALVMPKIGCGLDRLEWDKVREIIKKIFGNTDVNIIVCVR